MDNPPDLPAMSVDFRVGNASSKGRGRSNFLKLALRFRLDLFDLKTQNRRNSRTILRILCLKIGQRWPEDEMHKWGNYFVPVPNIVVCNK